MPLRARPGYREIDSYTMRILVVEDEEKVAAFIQRGLEQSAYGVDVAHTGEEALDLTVATTYDLILLDLMLPGISGLEVVRELRRRKVEVPVLALTAGARWTTASRGWTPAAMTTCPSRSPSRSCWPGSAPCSAAPPACACPSSSTGTWCWTPPRGRSPAPAAGSS
jgi:CheY-like chemotaxis protein